MHSADFRSFIKDSIGGYDARLSLGKEITRAFALQLLGQYGKTKQYSRPNEGGLSNGFYWEADTQYWGVSLLGDLNLSSLLSDG